LCFDTTIRQEDRCRYKREKGEGGGGGGAHLKPVQHVCDAEADTLGVVHGVRVQLVGPSDPVHDDHVEVVVQGLAVEGGHVGDELLHPARLVLHWRRGRGGGRGEDRQRSEYQIPLSILIQGRINLTHAERSGTCRYIE